MREYCAFIIYLTIHSQLVLEVNSSRILCIFATPSVSHQYVFRPYTEELAKRGHELVILTTDPYLPQERTADNVTEIDLGFSYQYLKEVYESIELKYLFKKGVIMDGTTQDLNFVLAWVMIYVKQLRDKERELKRAIEDYSHFDLIVIELMSEFYLILTEIFKAPVISFSSFHVVQNYFAAMGAVGHHPRLHPNLMRSNFYSSSFWNKVKNFYDDIKFTNNIKRIDLEITKLLKAEFGPNTPTIDELRENIDLLFINVHLIYDNNRAVPPSVVYLGGLHLKESKDVPQELKNYLDKSKRGVVYVSLGTNVQVDNMDKELLDAFVKALGSVPYDVLWKFNEDLLETTPDNVKIQKWFPQRDLLLHPNIKLFVTQGGLQSTDETIDAGVPIVCIPFLGDQWYNCHRSEVLGIGIQVDPRIMTADDLKNAITKVVEDESYQKNINYLRDTIRDQPQTPLERAIWWTEYVIRHGGARHLRSPAASLSWSEYLMLDVILPILISGIVVLIVFLIFIKYLYSVIITSVFYNKKKKCN